MAISKTLFIGVEGGQTSQRYAYSKFSDAEGSVDNYGHPFSIAEYKLVGVKTYQRKVVEVKKIKKEIKA
jgi:hypothetical protein